MSIRIIPISEVLQKLRQCLPLLKPIFESSNDDINYPALKHLLLYGKAKLIVGTEGHNLTCMAVINPGRTPAGTRIMYIPVISGVGISSYMNAFFSLVTDEAIANGCTELRGQITDDMWLRVLKKYGWTKHHTVISCPVNQVQK